MSVEVGIVNVMRGAGGMADRDALMREFHRLLRRRGHRPEAPSLERIDAAIAELEVAILPCQLPEEVRWFWRNAPLSADMFRVNPTGPAAALEIRKDSRFRPAPIVVIGDGGHEYLYAELAYDGGEPGWIYAHSLFGSCHPSPPLNAGSTDHAVLVFAGITELLAFWVSELKRPEPVEGEWWGDVFEVAKHQSALPPTIDVVDRAPINLNTMDHWPRRWRQSAGVGDEMFALTGRTHSVAELVAARWQGPVEAVLVGRVRNLGGGAHGVLARLTDDTGSVEVLILSSALDLGTSPSGTYELEVVATQKTGEEQKFEDFEGDFREVQRRALSGDIAGAAFAAMDGAHFISGAHPVSAIIKRPVL